MTNSESAGAVVHVVSLSLIDEPPHCLRLKIDQDKIEELARSINKYGLRNPIHVRKIGDRFEIIEGHRRFLAHRWLGLHDIRCFIDEVDDRQTRLLSIQENIQRADLTPIEEAIQVVYMIEDMNMSIDEIARALSRSPGWVDARYHLLSWPRELIDAVQDGHLSVAACRELAAVTDEEQRKFLLDHAIKSGATQRVTQAWRQAWELTRNITDPTAITPAERYQSLPPLTPQIPCFGCGRVFDINDIQIERFCPDCISAILEMRRIIESNASGVASS
ncbi:MAG: ParB/RepB/Spo0J family partition protein [Candidatus Zixiibacteriota bacterium]